MTKSTRVYYLKPGTDEKRFAIRNGDGFFTLSYEGNKKVNYEYTRSEERMIELILLKNCSVRCENKDAPSLLKRHLYVDDKPVRAT